MKTISDFGFQNAGTKEHFIVQEQKSIIEHRSNNRRISLFKSANRNRPTPKAMADGCPQSTIRRGFTLIELMVVIAIIGILASIMIPNVIKHLETGRKAKATADIDIFVKAIALYQIDNEGDLPKDLSNLWDSGAGGPYISSEQPKNLENNYKLNKEGDSGYTITAYDKKGEFLTDKTITFK